MGFALWALLLCLWLSEGMNCLNCICWREVMKLVYTLLCFERESERERFVGVFRKGWWGGVFKEYSRGTACFLLGGIALKFQSKHIWKDSSVV